jgi:hypothetical protein
VRVKPAPIAKAEFLALLCRREQAGAPCPKACADSTTETGVIHLRQLLWGLAIGSIAIGFFLLII